MPSIRAPPTPWPRASCRWGKRLQGCRKWRILYKRAGVAPPILPHNTGCGRVPGGRSGGFHCDGGTQGLELPREQLGGVDRLLEDYEAMTAITAVTTCH